MAHLTLLPPELMLMIFNFTKSNDYLSLKLSCKQFNALHKDDLSTFLLKCYGFDDQEVKEIKQGKIFWIKEVATDYANLGLAKLEFIIAHDRIEKALSKRLFPLNLENFLCTACGDIKPRRLFMDSRIKAFDTELVCNGISRRFVNADLLSRIRPCVPCRPEHAARPTVIVEGRRMFVCEECHEPHPFEERVHLRRSKHGSQCTGCADKSGLQYTVRKDQAGFIVYDDKITVEQILEDVATGRIKVDSKIKISGLSK